MFFTAGGWRIPERSLSPSAFLFTSEPWRFWALFFGRLSQPRNIRQTISRSFKSTRPRQRGLAGWRARNSSLDRGNAANHAPTRPGSDFHLAGAVLHVAVLSRRSSAKHFRRGGYEFVVVFSRCRVGRGLFWNVFARVFRIFFCSARARSSTWPQGYAHSLPDLRRHGTAFGRADPQQIFCCCFR